MLDILYRDDYLVAVHKPSGLLVHRTALDSRAERFAVQLLRDQIGRHVHPAHRLDRGTSGVLLFALDRNTAARMGACFAHRSVAKRYVAVVRGHPAVTGVIDHPLARQFDAAERLATHDGESVQAAVTNYTRLATTELPHRVDRYPSSRYALLELFPETGRRHQIRRHLKHIAHPIVGDATFGKGRHNRLFQTLFDSHRLLLACTGLAFDHPLTGARVAIDCPLADDFTSVTNALGWDYTPRTLPSAADSAQNDGSFHRPPSPTS